MTRRLVHIGLALALVLAPTLLPAQGARPAMASPDSAGATRPRLTPTPAALAVAEALLREMDLERMLRAGAMATFDVGLEQQPDAAQFRDVIEAWVTKYFSWAEMGTVMTQLYAETFTESELRAFLQFYQTPAGRQLARLTPELSRRGAEIGTAVGAKYGPELERMIRARAAELQAAGAPPE